MNKNELQEVLRLHKMWLNGEEGGVRANLGDADLRGAILVRADLRSANLEGADLGDADLRDADLRDADLRGADLRDADLRDADLRDADLRGADLGDADLRDADLRGADLRGADLVRADLGGANLVGANLRGANLRGANLVGANLEDVHFNENTAFFALQCPEEGSFIAYKKAVWFSPFIGGSKKVIVKLEITADAKRSSATTRKCRASKAKVLEIQDLEGNKVDFATVFSTHDIHFAYRVGDIVEVADFDENRWNECSTGIHFFITRQEAVNY